jgi:hypothetical protein
MSQIPRHHRDTGTAEAIPSSLPEMAFLREKSRPPLRACVGLWHSGLAGLKTRFLRGCHDVHLARGGLDSWARNEGGPGPAGRLRAVAFFAAEIQNTSLSCMVFWCSGILGWRWQKRGSCLGQWRFCTKNPEYQFLGGRILGRRLEKRGQRSLIVAKARAAKAAAISQKRTTTCGSLQPARWKWWCRGAQRKSRLPWVYLK